MRFIMFYRYLIFYFFFIFQFLSVIKQCSVLNNSSLFTRMVNNPTGEKSCTPKKIFPLFTKKTVNVRNYAISNKAMTHEYIPTL